LAAPFRIRTLFKEEVQMKSRGIFTIMLGFAGLASAQNPVVNANGVVNVASFAFAGLPNGDIAPGSMVVIFGSNMGPATLQQAATYPLPTSLGGTSVKVTSGGTITDAIINYTSAGQIAAIIPSNTPTGNATLTVTYNGKASAPASFKMVPNSFGVFAANQGGSGPGIIANAASKVFGLNSAANPGEAAVIWGTGLGAVTGNEAAGPLPGDMSSIPVEVYAGGVKAAVTYRGRSGCCAGVDQITFTVPAVTGCRVPVTLKINNVVSNYTTMAIAAAGTRTCSDAGGPSAADLQRFSVNGAAIGAVILTRIGSSITVPFVGTITNNSDVGSASFFKYSADQLNTSQNPFNTTTVGACTVSFFKGSTSVSADPILPLALDAGASISVSGAGGTKQLPKLTAGGFTTYSGALSSPTGTGYLEPGTFTISGPGGANIGAFQTTLTVPAVLTWTNMDNVVNINRATGQLITWTGGDPAGTVSIIGSSTSGTAADSVGASFICTAKASDGQFTIPPAVTLSLPVSPTVQGVPTGSLLVGTSTAVKSFTASGLDMGFALATVDALKTLSYQ
jgi:uncharacterized protein (TIGR03437 family)